MPRGMGEAGEQTSAVGTPARVVFSLGLGVHAAMARSPLVWLQEVEPPRGDGGLIISLHVCCARVPSHQGSPLMGTMAPPGRDAAARNMPTSHLTSKKSLQKTAITGPTPSPSCPLPWLHRVHKSSAGITGKRAARRAATISVWPTKQVLMPFMICSIILSRHSSTARRCWSGRWPKRSRISFTRWRPRMIWRLIPWR